MSEAWNRDDCVALLVDYDEGAFDAYPGEVLYGEVLDANIDGLEVRVFLAPGSARHTEELHAHEASSTIADVERCFAPEFRDRWFVQPEAGIGFLARLVRLSEAQLDRAARADFPADIDWARTALGISAPAQRTERDDPLRRARYAHRR
jgi:hypothetical protein